MKTAEEWRVIWKEMTNKHELPMPFNKAVNVFDALVQQIQLESMKEGMRRAREIALEINDGHEWPVTRKILSAAEQLTIKNL